MWIKENWMVCLCLVIFFFFLNMIAMVVSFSDLKLFCASIFTLSIFEIMEYHFVVSFISHPWRSPSLKILLSYHILSSMKNLENSWFLLVFVCLPKNLPNHSGKNKSLVYHVQTFYFTCRKVTIDTKELCKSFFVEKQHQPPGCDHIVI